MPRRTAKQAHPELPRTPAQRVLAQRIRDDLCHRVEFQVPLSRGPRRDPETDIHFWHPDRFGVRHAADTDRKALAAFHPDLAVTWHPLRERWLVWYRKPSVTHHLCPGWLLIYVWEHPETGAYLPLNLPLLFANLYRQSRMSFPNAEAYYDRLIHDAQRAKDAEDARDHEQRGRRSKDYFEYTKIKSIGLGSKFVHHHQDGLPSRAELEWRQQTAWMRMPQEVRDQMLRDRERRIANLLEGRRQMVTP